MTTQQFPRNKAIVFGIVDSRWQNMKDRKKGLPPEAAVRRFRNPALGETYQVQLQLASPYGNSFGLSVEVNAGVAGAEHLTVVRPGDVLVLEGHLVRTEAVDDRFASYGEEEIVDGIHYRDVSFKVSSLRPREEKDPASAGSSVWVEGLVMEPPALFRHPQHPEILFARMRLRAKTPLQIGDSALFPVLEQTCEMTVIVPTEHEDAGYLYRRGNQVRIRGVLERLPLRQGGAEVRNRLGELDAAWRVKQSELQGDARALRAEGQQHLRERGRLERSPRTMVLAAEVQPLAGAEPLDLDAAQREREAYTSQQRQARAARIERSNGRRRVQMAEAQEQVVGTDAAEPAPERVRPPRRPRPMVTRRAGEDVEAAGDGADADRANVEEPMGTVDAASSVPEEAVVMVAGEEGAEGDL